MVGLDASPKNRRNTGMSRTQRVLLWLMAFFYAFAGFSHLLNPEFFVAIVPPGLPNPEWLNVLSGLAEIILAVFVLEPRTRVYAAWGIIALLIAVFPANLYVTLENVGPGGPGCWESKCFVWKLGSSRYGAESCNL